jgi:hypothetical protein
MYTSLSNRLKPFIQTTNIIKTTDLIIITALINRAITAKAGKTNIIYAKKRTAVYKDIYQKNTSALKKYIKHNLI